jgi:hypothetical protein
MTFEDESERTPSPLGPDGGSPFDPRGDAGADRDPGPRSSPEVPFTGTAFGSPTWGSAPEPPPGPVWNPDSGPVVEPVPGQAMLPEVPPRRRPPYLRYALILLVAFVTVGTIAYLRRPDPIQQLGEQVFARVPGDARDALVSDLRSAVGNQLDNLSAVDQRTRVSTMIRDGYARLGDAQLGRRLQLEVKALDRSDAAACAAYGRASFGSGSMPPDVALNLINALDTADLTEWYQLAVQAIKADVAGTTPARSVSQADFVAAFRPVINQLSASEAATITAVTQDLAGSSDADVCRAVRIIYDTTVATAGIDLATVSLFDLQGTSGP